MRKALGKVTPGQHLTKLPGPRVLIEDGQFSATARNGRQHLTSLFDAQDLAERLRATVPTAAVAAYLSDFHLNEWDCIVTATRPVS